MLACPEGTTSSAGATSIESCTALAGYYAGVNADGEYVHGRCPGNGAYSSLAGSTSIDDCTIFVSAPAGFYMGPACAPISGVKVWESAESCYRQGCSDSVPGGYPTASQTLSDGTTSISCGAHSTHVSMNSATYGPTNDLSTAMEQCDSYSSTTANKEKCYAVNIGKSQSVLSAYGEDLPDTTVDTWYMVQCADSDLFVDSTGFGSCTSSASYTSFVRLPKTSFAHYACPPGSTSAPGATSVDDCYCPDPNSFLTADKSACICNPGYATPSNTVNPDDGACALHLCGANEYPVVHSYHEVATILGKKKANGCQDPSTAALLAAKSLGATFTANEFQFFEPNNVALGDNGHMLYIRSANSFFRMDLRMNLVERLFGKSNTAWSQARYNANEIFDDCGDDVPVGDSTADYNLMVISPDNHYMYASDVGGTENIARIDINPYSPKFRCATNFVGQTSAGTDDGVGSNAKFQYIYGGDMSQDGTKIVTFSKGKGTVRLIDVATATVSTLAGGGSNKATKKSNAASPLNTAEHAAAYDGVGSSALFREIKQARFSHDGSTVYVMDDYYVTSGHTKNVLRKIDVNTATVTTIFSPNGASHEYMPEFVVMNTGNLAVMLYYGDTLFGTGGTTTSGIVEFQPDGTYVQVLMDMQSSTACSVSSVPCCADGNLETARLGSPNTGSAMAMSDTTLYIADFSMDTVRTLELPGAYCQTCPYLSGSSPGITTVDQCAYPPCDANFFGPGGLDCHACPPGSTSVSGSNAVLSDCVCTDPNAAPNAIGTICTCNAGYTGPDGGSCTACTGNTYKEYPGSQPCDACPDRSTSPQASTSLDACSCEANSYTGDVKIDNAQTETSGLFTYEQSSGNWYDNYNDVVEISMDGVDYYLYIMNHCIRRIRKDAMPDSSNPTTGDGFIGGDSAANCASSPGTFVSGQGVIMSTFADRFKWPWKMEKSFDETKLYVLSAGHTTTAYNVPTQAMTVHEIDLTTSSISLILTADQTKGNMGGGFNQWFDITIYRRLGVDYMIITAAERPCMYSLNLATYEYLPMDECSQTTSSGQNTKAPDGGGTTGARFTTAVTADNINDRIFVMACPSSSYYNYGCQIQLVSWSTDGTSTFTAFLKSSDTANQNQNNLIWQSGNLVFAPKRNELYWSSRYYTYTNANSYGHMYYDSQSYYGYIKKLDLSGCSSLSDCTNVAIATVNAQTKPITWVYLYDSASWVPNGGAGMMPSANSQTLVKNLKLSDDETVLFVPNRHSSSSYEAYASALGPFSYSEPGCPACPAGSTSSVGATALTDCACASGRYMDVVFEECAFCPTDHTSDVGSTDRFGCQLSCDFPRWIDTTPDNNEALNVGYGNYLEVLGSGSWWNPSNMMPDSSSGQYGKYALSAIDADHFAVRGGNSFYSHIYKLCFTCLGGDFSNTYAATNPNGFYELWIGGVNGNTNYDLVDGIGTNANVGVGMAMVRSNDNRFLYLFDADNGAGRNTDGNPFASWWAIRIINIATAEIYTWIKNHPLMVPDDSGAHMAFDAADNLYLVSSEDQNPDHGDKGCVIKITPDATVTEHVCGMFFARGLAVVQTGALAGAIFVAHGTADSYSSGFEEISMIRQDLSIVRVIGGNSGGYGIKGLHYEAFNNILYYERDRTNAVKYIEAIRLDQFDCAVDSTGSCIAVGITDRNTIRPDCASSSDAQCKVTETLYAQQPNTATTSTVGGMTFSFDRTFFITIGSTGSQNWKPLFLDIGAIQTTTPRCGACPSGATTPAGIDGYDDCVCGGNGEEVIATVDPPVCECGAGWNTQDDGTCDAKCGVGTYPSTGTTTTTSQYGAWSADSNGMATTKYQPMNGRGVATSLKANHIESPWTTITTNGDGSGESAGYGQLGYMVIKDSSTAFMLDMDARCIRKMTLPAPSGGDMSLQGFAGICNAHNGVGSMTALTSGDYFKYNGVKLPASGANFGIDGVPFVSSTVVTGITPKGMQDGALSRDGQYMYVGFSGNNVMPWVTATPHPVTGVTTSQYSNAVIGRIRLSDGYYQQLTNRIFYTNGQHYTTIPDPSRHENWLIWVNGYHDNMGLAINPVDGKLIIAYKNRGHIISLDVESLLGSGCTPLSPFGAFGGCAEAQDAAELVLRGESAEYTWTGVAVTPDGRIFVTNDDHVYLLSEPTKQHSLLGGGYSRTLIKAVEDGSNTHHFYTIRAWGNDRLLMTALEHYTGRETRVMYIDISNQDNWPYDFHNTNLYGNPSGLGLQQAVIHTATKEEMGTSYWQFGYLERAEYPLAVSPDYTFALWGERYNAHASYRRIVRFTLGDATVPVEACSNCPTDTTSPAGSVDVTDCVNPCDANFYGTGNADCTACPANSESTEGTITIDGCLCKAGYAGSASDGCVACLYANDEYQPDPGQASCLTCDANASPTGDAAVACQCDAGYTGAAGSCSACGEGSYKASPGAEACTSCPANTESSAASTSVNDCECQAGTEAPANGQACTECPVSEYKQATGASDCISCGTGATTLLPRSDDPSECVPDAGYTGSAGGPFTECGVGFYKSSAGTGACTTCYAHSTTSGTGSTSIDACSCVQPAYADDADGLHLCDCGAGYYWDGSACVLCGADSFCVGGDTSTAVQTACSTVDPNSVSPAGSDAADDCVCDVGFKQGATCEACAAGSYSDAVDSASCSSCGANLNTYDTSSGYHTSQATAATGADAESDCLAVPNFYKSGTAGLACPSNTWTAGRVGTVEYGSGIVSEHCVCQAGHYYSGDVYTRSSSDGCSVCPAGSYCPGGVFDTDLGQWAVEWEAQLCTAGAGGSVDPAYQHLTSDGGATAISRDDCYCKAGYVGPNGQANGCNECAVGSYCPGGEVAANCPTGATSPVGSDVITDCVCKAGFYGPDGEDCFTCPAGSYCPGGTVVITCPAGSSSLPGADSILACLCNAGFTGPNGGPCTACEVGTYKPVTGPDTCTDCPSFTSSPSQSDELTDCTCVAGYTGPDGQSCVACNPGEYKDVTGSSACQACTANSMSEAGAPTADSCLCDPGYTGTGSGGCTICSANLYKELAGPAACDACPTHSTSPSGSDEAEDCVCDAGYSGVNGGTCTACPPGKYCVQGEASPSDCPTNALTIEALSDDVSDCVCDLGYSGHINTITDQCLECNPGFYNNEYDGVCNQCTQHSSSSAGSTAATDCKCIPGATGPDGGECTLCAVGEYKVGSGSASCETCPQHSTSEQGSDALLDCRCQKGYTGPDGQACFACNAGEYKDTLGNAACSDCPDFTQSPAGSDELTDCTCIDGYVGPDGAECGRECPPGFEPGPANLRCVGCTPGTYKPTEGDEECTACPANSDHALYNQTSQLVCDCVQGYTKDEAAFAGGSVQCTQCPDGSFGNHNFENLCHQCYAMVDGVCSPYSGADHTHCPGICQVPAGYQVTASGNNLELCPIGTYNVGGSILQCQACPVGSVNADVVGASSLAACLCLPGYTRTDLNAACQPCATGTYKDSSDVAGVGGMGTCSTCPADSSSLAASDALTDCKCNAGFTGADGGACTACDAGTYKVVVGSSACLTCPDHSSSPPQSTAKADCVCNAGAAGPSGGPCELCAIGSFSDTAGAGACTPCGSDTTTQSTGSDARSDCLCATGFEGHPTDGGPTTTSGSCVPSCAAGQTYSDAAEACVACAADTYKVATGAHSCTACADPRNASAVGSDELADCTCREAEMGLFGPAVAIVTALGSYNLPKTHAGSPASIAAADSHRLKDITFTGMTGAGVTVTVAHSGTTLTLFACEPRDCADKTVQLYGLRGTLSVTVTAGSPAWSVDVWEGRGWTARPPHENTIILSDVFLASDNEQELTVGRDISKFVLAFDLSVGDHVFSLQDGAPVYHEPHPEGTAGQFVCAPCPPGVICGAPVPYP